MVINLPSFFLSRLKSDLPPLAESSASGEAIFPLVQSNPAWRGVLEREYDATIKIALQNRPLIEAIQRRLLRDRVLFREDFATIWTMHVRKEKSLCQSAA